MPIMGSRRVGKIDTARIAVGRYDEQTLRSIKSLNSHPPEAIVNEDLSKYIKPSISLAMLERTNLVLSYGPDEELNCSEKRDNKTYINDILFSSLSNEVFTNASACSSYMLFREDLKVVAATQVAILKDESADYSENISFHHKMVMHAYANLRNLAPEGRISAYISGLSLENLPGVTSVSHIKMIDNRMLITSVLEDLVRRGVDVKAVDIGREYMRQRFILDTGKFDVLPPLPKP